MYVRLKFKARHNVTQDDYADISCIIFSWFDCHFYRAYKKEVNAYAIMTDEEFCDLKNKINKLETKEYKIELKVFESQTDWENAAMRETNAPLTVFTRAFGY